MLLMKRFVIVVVLSLVMTAFAAAQDKPAQDKPKPDAPKTETKPVTETSKSPTPSVDQILDDFVKALGGKETLEKISSRTSKGSFDIEAMNATGTFEHYAKAPDKSAVYVNIPNFGLVPEIYDGTKAWSSDPMSGIRELSGVELATRKRDSDFHQSTNLKKHYSKMEVKGREKVGSSEAYVIEATPSEGSPEKLYFDTETHLLVRRDVERESAQGKVPVEIYMEDYKVIDGIKLAHTMRQVTPAFAFSIKFTEIKHNVEIDETKFNKPTGN
jgi:zinc protease